MTGHVLELFTINLSPIELIEQFTIASSSLYSCKNFNEIARKYNELLQ